MFITLEDETGIANLVVWTRVFERFRRAVLTASLLGVEGRTQREGAVVHVVAYKLEDLSDRLASLGERETPFPLRQGCGDAFAHGPIGPDPRDVEGMAAGTSSSPTFTSGN